MTEICLCIRIHTPAMLANYRFMNINHHHNYFDEEKQRDRILKLYSETFVPFFEILKNQSINTEKKFKTGISVSGISLSYFKRFVPQFIDLLNELKEENIIEFLSESYSNSSVTSGYTRATIRQIALHNVVMKSLFDVVPETFLTSSPVISNDIFTTIFGCGKKSIFSYSNHFEQNNNSNWHDENFLSDNYREFLINYKCKPVIAANKLQALFKKGKVYGFI